jgi:hypothetical protein
MTGRFTVGNTLSRSLSIYGANFAPFFTISLLVQLPMLIYIVMVRPETDQELLNYSLLSGVANMVLTLIATGAIIYGVIQQMRGHHVSMGDCLAVGLKRLLPVIGVAIVVGIAIAIGLVLLIVPGIILMCMFWLAVPAAVIEQAGVGQAMSRSTELTRGYKGTIFLIVFLIGIVNFALAMIAQTVFMDDIFLYLIVAHFLTVITAAWTSVANAVAYHDIRAVKENVDIEELSKVFA